MLVIRFFATCRSWLSRNPTAKRSEQKISSANCITVRCTMSFAQLGKLRSKAGSGPCWTAGNFNIFFELFDNFSKLGIPQSDAVHAGCLCVCQRQPGRPISCQHVQQRTSPGAVPCVRVSTQVFDVFFEVFDVFFDVFNVFFKIIQLRWVRLQRPCQGAEVENAHCGRHKCGTWRGFIQKKRAGGQAEENFQWETFSSKNIKLTLNYLVFFMQCTAPRAVSVGCGGGGNPYGIHLAAGPDWMHLMHEGLGKHLLTYICAVLKKSGRNLEEFYKIHRNNIKVFFCFSGKLKKIDSYVAALDRRTSAMPSGLKKISDGLESIGTLSAMDLPGVLAQVALAIGSHSSGDLPSAVTKNVQHAITTISHSSASANATSQTKSRLRWDIQKQCFIFLNECFIIHKWCFIFLDECFILSLCFPGIPS